MDHMRFIDFDVTRFGAGLITSIIVLWLSTPSSPNISINHFIETWHFNNCCARLSWHQTTLIKMISILQQSRISKLVVFVHSYQNKSLKVWRFPFPFDLSLVEPLRYMNLSTTRILIFQIFWTIWASNLSCAVNKIQVAPVWFMIWNIFSDKMLWRLTLESFSPP